MEDGPKEHVHIAEGQDDGVHMLSSSDPRAVTCRYDMKKLRQVGGSFCRQTHKKFWDTPAHARVLGHTFHSKSMTHA